jgi:hypothetical protein
MNDNIRKAAYSKANKMMDGDKSISINDFVIDELKLLLLTTDGIGKRMKVKILEELLNRKEKLDAIPFINGCDRNAIAALRFLADNKRPMGGNDKFNSEHLYLIAQELELSLNNRK